MSRAEGREVFRAPPSLGSGVDCGSRRIAMRDDDEDDEPARTGLDPMDLALGRRERSERTDRRAPRRVR